MRFSDVIEECVRLMGGGKALAQALGVSPSEVTRIRSMEGKLSIPVINHLLEIAGLEIKPRGHEARLRDALKTMAVLWAEADAHIDKRKK